MTNNRPIKILLKDSKETESILSTENEFKKEILTLDVDDIDIDIEDDNDTNLAKKNQIKNQINTNLNPNQTKKGIVERLPSKIDTKVDEFGQLSTSTRIEAQGHNEHSTKTKSTTNQSNRISFNNTNPNQTKHHSNINSNISTCCMIPCIYSPPSPLFPISKLKQRFKRILIQQYPNHVKMADMALVSSKNDMRDSGSETSGDFLGQRGDLFCCLAHLKHALQVRADELVEEDLTEFARFQDTVMKDLEVYELEEDHWQEQFYLSRTIGEKAADVVAKFGGSWGFLLALGAFIGSWAALNLILPTPWDPYPFILLNLFLSMLASTQAPVIMMSQNRQAAIDRLQNNYISKTILRNENQTKHVDAKLDHLISYQWKRLLEIQEIQIQLLQEVVSDYTNRGRASVRRSHGEKMVGGSGGGGTIPSSPTMGKKKSWFWSGESHEDPFTLLLLRKSLGINQPDDQLIFSHWHNEGDNYTGDIRNVTMTSLKDHLSSISFDIYFSNKATLDDILQGEVNITFRNDFNLSQMNLTGRIASIRLLGTNLSPTPLFVNGEFPPRYKPTFVRHRPDRITDTWKCQFDGVQVNYTPPPPFCVVHVSEGMCLRNCTVSTFHELGIESVCIRVVQGVVDYGKVCFDLERFMEGKGKEGNEKADIGLGKLEDGFEENVRFGGWNKVGVVEQVPAERVGVYPTYEVQFTSETVSFLKVEGGDEYRNGIPGPCTVLLTGRGRLGWQGVVERERNQDLSKKFLEIDSLKEEMMADLL